MVYAELTEPERKRFKIILEDHLTYVDIKNNLESSNKMVLTPFVGEFDVSQIEKFEQMNNISILLLGHENKRFYPINTVSVIREKHVDLLVLKKRKEINLEYLHKEQVSTTYEYHVVCIKDIRGVLGLPRRSQNLCRICLKTFVVSLERHSATCTFNGIQRTKYPKAKYFKFRKPYLKMPLAYTIYFQIMTYYNRHEDFELSDDSLNYQRIEGNLK
jgi:hypothetical protein